MPNYEELGPQRFEQFCQALISYEHPDLQAYPLNQADGGRDATAGPFEGSSRAIVFQVKFASQPQGVVDPVTWLAAALRDERPKIDLLAARGAKSYRLITNLPGSGRLDTGQMDRLDKILADLSIPDAVCLWRPDIDIRLAKHPFLKWSFRELWSGQDLLDGAVLDAVSHHHERRLRALRSFLSAQADKDGTVRFRQVGLRQELLDLWVDVPLMGLEYSDLPKCPPNTGARDLIESLADPRQSPRVPAAYALLYGETAAMDRLVVRGAPGQGKSTLGQFICQVHRCRILADDDAISRITPYRDAPLRLPFRVDVKHLAAYLAGRDALNRNATLGGEYPRSLDGFLAHLVSVASGGDAFDVADLKACLALGPTLVVLDGLDEVGDPSERVDVVDAIDRGAVTLAAVNPNGFRIVVTSRPAAFASGAAFRSDRWRETSLVDLPPATIVAYAVAWADTHALDPEEGNELSHLLEERLADHEFAELTRNPMQLTIVLSLLIRRGRSLPDKRTQLYAEYMAHFLDREAEKSRIVAEQRELIYQLHAYLAYRMHGAAERDSSDGKIEVGALRREIEGFVQRTEGGAELAERLLEGIVERVMALVSRDGRVFEFEVQPLREFFAGHYLYDSAPVARFEPVAGTLPERFELLTKSPFWLNVLRFFAGCYTSEALSSLADGLADFHVDPLWGRTDQPRVVAAFLLRDRVFNLNLQARDRAVQGLLAEVPSGHVLSWGAGSAASDGLRLSDQRAVELLADRALDAIVDNTVNLDRRLGAARALAAHADHEAARALWYARFTEATGDDRDMLARAGCIGELAGAATTGELLGGDPSDSLVLATLDRDPDAIEASEDLSRRTVEAVVRHGVVLPQRLRVTSAIYAWASALSTSKIAFMHSARSRNTSATVLAIIGILQHARDHRGLEGESIIPESGKAFGWSVRLTCEAIKLAAARDRREPAFHHTGGALGKFARLAFDGAKWDEDVWMAECATGREYAGTSPVAVYVSLLMWGSDDVVGALKDALVSFLDNLDGDELTHVLAAVRWATDTGFRASRRGTLPTGTTRFGAAMAARQPAVLFSDGLSATAERVAGADDGVRQFFGNVALELVRRGNLYPAALKMIAEVYCVTLNWAPEMGSEHAMALRSAEAVVEERARYPIALVEAAEERVGTDARSRARPFVDAAATSGWM